MDNFLHNAIIGRVFNTKASAIEFALAYSKHANPSIYKVKITEV